MSFSTPRLSRGDSSAGPFYSLVTYLLPWLAGPVIIRIPESSYLLTVVAQHQFWFYTLSAATFGLTTCILQGVYEPVRRKGILNLTVLGLTLCVLIAGFLLAFEAVRTRLSEEIFGLIVGFLVSFAFFLFASKRGFTLGIIIAGTLTPFLAAELSMVILSGSLLWPSWVLAVSFALPSLALNAYAYGYPKLASAALVVFPLLVAWLVSLTLLPLPYLLTGILYVGIASLLTKISSSADTAPTSPLNLSTWKDQVNKIAVTFLALMILARML